MIYQVPDVNDRLLNLAMDVLADKGEAFATARQAGVLEGRKQIARAIIEILEGN